MTAPTSPLYDIDVQLSGQDGNAFGILGAVRKALKGNDVPEEELTSFWDEATSGDYDHLLRTCMRWVNVQ